MKSAPLKTRRTNARKRRARRSGVVLVEAVIAIALLIVFFASTAYFHNMYLAKARSMRMARVQAWLATERSCQGDGRGGGSAIALVPAQFARTSGAQTTVSSRHEMTCTEKNDPHTDLIAVFNWAGLGDGLSSVLGQIAGAVF